jgi:hypothetical protein
LKLNIYLLNEHFKLVFFLNFQIDQKIKKIKNKFGKLKLHKEIKFINKNLLKSDIELMMIINH